MVGGVDGRSVHGEEAGRGSEELAYRGSGNVVVQNQTADEGGGVSRSDVLDVCLSEILKVAGDAGDRAAVDDSVDGVGVDGDAVNVEVRRGLSGAEAGGIDRAGSAIPEQFFLAEGAEDRYAEGVVDDMDLDPLHAPAVGVVVVAPARAEALDLDVLEVALGDPAVGGLDAGCEIAAPAGSEAAAVGLEGDVAQAAAGRVAATAHGTPTEVHGDCGGVGRVVEAGVAVYVTYGVGCSTTTFKDHKLALGGENDGSGVGVAGAQKFG